MAATTTAAVLREAGAGFELAELAVSGPARNEVLVELAGTGLCHTDLTVAATGLDPAHGCVLGHEGAGTVLAAGPGVEGLAPGDRVVLSFAHCGECRSCGAGRPAYCERSFALNFAGRRADGSTALTDADGSSVLSHFFGQSSFARHAVAHASSAVRVDATPDELPLLGPLGCSVQTGAGTVLGALAPVTGRTLAVFGAGAVGISALLAAVADGAAKVHVVEPDAGRRELALALGAATALDPAEGDVARALRKATKGGADLAVDTVGSAPVIATALRALRSPGRCATLAMRLGPNPIEIDQTLLLFGRTLEGVIEGDADPHRLIPRLLKLWREGRLPFDRFVRSYPFEEINTACEDARAGRTIKPVLSFETAATETEGQG